MTGYEGEDLDDRLDRGSEAAEKAAPAEALALLAGVRESLLERALRFPASAEAQDDLARCFAAEGIALARAGRAVDAIAATREAIARHDAASRLDAVGGGRRGPRASLGLRLAGLLDTTGRLPEALAEASAAAADAETLGAESPEDRRPLALAADAYRAIASLHARMGAVTASAAAHESARACASRIFALDPADGGAARRFAAALRDVAWSRRQIADPDGALAALNEARTLLERGAAQFPSDVGWQKDLAITRAVAGQALGGLSRFREAMAEAEAALFVTESLLSLEPGDDDTRRQLVRRHEEIGDLHLAMGNTADAVVGYERRLDAVRRLLPEDAHLLGSALIDLGDAQHALGDDHAAAARFADACAALEDLPDDDADAAAHLGFALGRLGDAQTSSGIAGAALATRRRCVEVQRRVKRLVPAHARSDEGLGFALDRLGTSLLDGGDLEGAETVLRESLAVWQRRASRDGTPWEARHCVAIVHVLLWRVLTRRERHDEAAAEVRAASAIRRAIVAGTPDAPDVAQQLVWDRRRLAESLNGAGDSAAAERELRAGTEEADRRASGADASSGWIYLAAGIHDELGDWLERRGDNAGAADEAEREAEYSARYAADDESDVERWEHLSRCRREVATLRERIGDAASGLVWRERAVDAQARAVALRPSSPESRSALSNAIDGLGRARWRSGDVAGALREFRLALPIDEQLAREAPGDRARMTSLAIAHEAIRDTSVAAEKKEKAAVAAVAAVAVRRELAAGGTDDDHRRLRWSLYESSTALRDAGRRDEALAAAEESRTLCEQRLAEKPDDLNALGLLGNAREIVADLLDRADPAQRETARRYYAANVEIFRTHPPETVSHKKDCTCLVDNERKLRELDAANGSAPPV